MDSIYCGGLESCNKLWWLLVHFAATWGPQFEGEMDRFHTTDDGYYKDRRNAMHLKFHDEAEAVLPGSSRWGVFTPAAVVRLLAPAWWRRVCFSQDVSHRFLECWLYTQFPLRGQMFEDVVEILHCFCEMVHWSDYVAAVPGEIRTFQDLMDARASMVRRLRQLKQEQWELRRRMAGAHLACNFFEFVTSNLDDSQLTSLIKSSSEQNERLSFPSSSPPPAALSSFHASRLHTNYTHKSRRCSLLCCGLLVYVTGLHAAQATRTSFQCNHAWIIMCPQLGSFRHFGIMCSTVRALLQGLRQTCAHLMLWSSWRAQIARDLLAQGAFSMSGSSEELEEVWVESPEETRARAGPPPPHPVQVEQALAHRISRAVARELPSFVGPIVCYIPWHHAGLTSMRITVEPMREQDRAHQNLLNWGADGPREDLQGRTEGPGLEDRNLSYLLSAAIGDAMMRHGRPTQVVLTRLAPEITAPDRREAMLTANVRRMKNAEAGDELALWTGSPSSDDGAVEPTVMGEAASRINSARGLITRAEAEELTAQLRAALMAEEAEEAAASSTTPGTTSRVEATAGALTSTTAPPSTPTPTPRSASSAAPKPKPSRKWAAYLRSLVVLSSGWFLQGISQQLCFSGDLAP
ncbi:CFDP2 [Symbiodinium sp. CCMP2592]|nr:CFDP2 [Symbiodinium sp. CCMP2592]